MLIALVALAAPVGLYALYLLWHARAFVLLNPGIPRLPEVEFLPLVSVVIPARNEAATVGRCLRALIQQTYPPDRLEVILVDDHSSDGTLSVADAYKPAVPICQPICPSRVSERSSAPAAAELPQ